MGLAVGLGNGRKVGAREGLDVEGKYVGWVLTDGFTVGARLGGYVGEAEVGLALVEGAKDGRRVGIVVGSAKDVEAERKVAVHMHVYTYMNISKHNECKCKWRPVKTEKEELQTNHDCGAYLRRQCGSIDVL